MFIDFALLGGIAIGLIALKIALVYMPSHGAKHPV